MNVGGQWVGMEVWGRGWQGLGIGAWVRGTGRDAESGGWWGSSTYKHIKLDYGYMIRLFFYIYEYLEYF